MRDYSYWLPLAKRYDKIVDYGSPMTAWTAEMSKAFNRANGDKLEAMRIINESKKHANK